MSDRYILEEVPKDKLTITGSIYSDILFDHINADKKLADAFNENTVISKGELKVLVWCRLQRVSLVAKRAIQ